MTRQKLAIGVVALGFTLSALPVWAQGERGRPAGSESTGSAVSRPSEGGGGGSSGGGGGTVSGGSSSTTSSGGGGGSAWAPEPSRPEAARERAPQHPGARRGGGDRPRGGGEATGRAVPRGTSSGGGDATTSSSGDRGRDRDRVSAPQDRAVPAYSRPRDGRTPTGRVAERLGPIPDRDGRGGYYYSPYPSSYYYDPYGYYGSYWYPGYALGLGYFYYDPFWYGSYGSYGYGGGYGYQGTGSGSYAYSESGSLRLKLKPRDAQVFVDGYFVGNVDSFDGVFQRLNVEAGGHKIEIRAPGYDTLVFDVLITPGETVTYKGEMERIK